jgi:hypothetical protein
VHALGLKGKPPSTLMSYPLPCATAGTKLIIVTT